MLVRSISKTLLFHNDRKSEYLRVGYYVINCSSMSTTNTNNTTDGGANNNNKIVNQGRESFDAGKFFNKNALKTDDPLLVSQVPSPVRTPYSSTTPSTTIESPSSSKEFNRRVTLNNNNQTEFVSNTVTSVEAIRFPSSKKAPSKTIIVNHRLTGLPSIKVEYHAPEPSLSESQAKELAEKVLFSEDYLPQSVINKQRKAKSIEAVQRHAVDTGSPEAQIAAFSEKIKYLTAHMKTTKRKDKHSLRGFMNLMEKRKKMLAYLKKKNPDAFQEVAKRFDIRKGQLEKAEARKPANS